MGSVALKVLTAYADHRAGESVAKNTLIRQYPHIQMFRCNLPSFISFHAVLETQIDAIDVRL